MSQYKDFFNCVLTNPLEAFGYERWTTDNIYFGLSNLPAIAELFVETKAFEDQNVIVQPKYMSSFCTFIYPDEKMYSPKYNEFRKRLEEHLEIRTSFYVLKRYPDYCETFVWNFKKPTISLPEEKQLIINDFNSLKNSILINTCINQFKKDIALLSFKKAFTYINIGQQFPLYTGEKPARNMEDYSQYVELSHYVKLLQKEDLTFRDFGLSQQERETLEAFLKTINITSHSSEILKNISLKLEILKYSEDFWK